MCNTDEVNKKKNYNQLDINTFFFNQRASQSLYQIINSQPQLNVMFLGVVTSLTLGLEQPYSLLVLSLGDKGKRYYAGEMKVVI